MYLQEFKIYLIGGHVLKAAEEVTIPAEHRLLNRFKKAKPDDILSVGSEETSQASISGEIVCRISMTLMQWGEPGAILINSPPILLQARLNS